MDRAILARDPLKMGHPTTGRLFLVRGETRTELCRTLELPWENNASGISCIPAGSYRMAYVHSPRYGRKMWRVLDVPKRSGILIHAANFVRQLRGCIAPGLGLADIDKDGKLDATQSGPAMEAVLRALKPYEDAELALVVVNGADPR